MARTRTQKDQEQEITNQIIDLIEGGMVDGKWERPWTKIGVLPFNAITGKTYRGINLLMGMIAGGGAFATYKQWQDLGGQVPGGTSGTYMFRPITIQRKDDNGNPIMDAQGNPDTFKVFKAFKAFAAHQQEGWEPEQREVIEFDSVDAAEQIIADTGARIQHGNSDRAFYSPSSDAITMPGRDQFSTTQGYYGTVLHELVHWTGHSSRLARDFSGRFGDEAYAFEELVAELGATFLCAAMGIEQEADHNHVKYVKSWIKILKGDKKAIKDAAALAQKAVDYIMDATKTQDVEDIQQAA